MRKPVLLKVPGVKMVRVEALTNFINSAANSPPVRGRSIDEHKPADKQRYVKLLDMEIASPKGEADPGYDLSLQILTEFTVSDAEREEGSTPRAVIEEIFGRLGIFPKIRS